MSRRRRGRRQLRPSDAFWGRREDTPAPVSPITPTLDPSAVPRSLGDPPLSINAAAAQHHLSVVYEEAVRAATALAAANGLLDAGAGSDDVG
ncbi:MAG TPA: hypothetical protein VHM89_16395 [Acidimicrobiales bacterium]|nr:hypothetical protein [Acidimicrobiales bacterium]